MLSQACAGARHTSELVIMLPALLDALPTVLPGAMHTNSRDELLFCGCQQSTSTADLTFIVMQCAG